MHAGATCLPCPAVGADLDAQLGPFVPRSALGTNSSAACSLCAVRTTEYMVERSTTVAKALATGKCLCKAGSTNWTRDPDTTVQRCTVRCGTWRLAQRLWEGAGEGGDLGPVLLLYCTWSAI